jgi:hypothetical protein
MTSSKLHQLEIEGKLNRMKNDRHKKMTRRASMTKTKPGGGRPKRTKLCRRKKWVEGDPRSAKCVRDIHVGV